LHTHLAQPFTLCSPKAVHLLPREHGEIGGDERWGGKTMTCWKTKSAISLIHVKIQEKLLWRAYKKSPTLFQMYHPRPIRPSLPQYWGFATPPKIPVAIISGTGKATNFKFGPNIPMVHPNNFGERGAWAYPETAEIF